jgi:cell division protein ZapA
MAEVTITINGRHYDIACDSGQEGRIIDLAGYLDERIGHISQTGAAYNDSHLQILTLLVVADELFEAREGQVSDNVDVNKLANDLRKEIRAEVESEYEAKLAQQKAQPPVTAESADFEDTADGKASLKVLQHLADRVNTLAARVEAL